MPVVMVGDTGLGSALNLNIHFLMLFLDGVYIGGSNGHPDSLERDTGNIYLTPESVDASDEDPSFHKIDWFGFKCVVQEICFLLIDLTSEDMSITMVG